MEQEALDRAQAAEAALLAANLEKIKAMGAAQKQVQGEAPKEDGETHRVAPGGSSYERRVSDLVWFSAMPFVFESSTGMIHHLSAKFSQLTLRYKPDQRPSVSSTLYSAASAISWTKPPPPLSPRPPGAPRPGA
jgi:hypothetical protein